MISEKVYVSEFLGEVADREIVWLITGVAGFIGSNLAEFLLIHNQKVVGVDNFSTGTQNNLDELSLSIGHKKMSNFTFIEGDLTDLEFCNDIVNGVDVILHQGALGSVPRSIADPIKSHNNNVNSFLNLIESARLNKVNSFVFASSSSVYGDHPALPKIEATIGRPLSPYASTKLFNEIQAEVYWKNYAFRSIGLRYFNVFGRRQSIHGPYAAVIPKWLDSMLNGNNITIYGDGSTSRDFCYIDNVVQANILAAIKLLNKELEFDIFNVAFEDRTSLLKLAKLIQSCMSKRYIQINTTIEFSEFRKGDVKHSHASIEKAKNLLGYCPQYSIEKGLELTVDWYIDYQLRQNEK